MLGHECSFPNSHFLGSVVRNNKRSSGIKRQNQRQPFQKLFMLPLSWVTFLLVTSLNRLNLWLFFTDFLMVTALLVKNNQIKKLKKVRYILLILCAWFTSFSIRHEAHQDNQNINVWSRTEARAGSGAMKKESSGAGAMFMKRRAAELELWHFYDGSAVPK